MNPKWIYAGAHTLGRARRADSGWSGPWVRGRGQFIFDNRYYIEMIDPLNNFAQVSFQSIAT